MSDIEEEIRRQMLEERQQAQASALPSLPPLSPSYIQPVPPIAPPASRRPANRGGLWGGLATLGALLAKSKGLLALLKFASLAKILITGGSMLLSMALYAGRYGWAFGIGFVLLIFVHELGHVIAAKVLRIPVGNMIFLPFMGAMVTHGRTRDAGENAFIAIMGPLVGIFGGIVCMLIYSTTQQPIYLYLTWWAFLLNWLNLLPFWILDGSKVFPVLTSKEVIVGVLILLATSWQSPLAWVFALALLGGNLARHYLKTPVLTHEVEGATRLRYVIGYIGLIILCAFATQATQTQLNDIGFVRGRTPGSGLGSVRGGE